MFGLPPVQTSESIMDSEVLLFSPLVEGIPQYIRGELQLKKTGTPTQ
jgi:hypothetical protein